MSKLWGIAFADSSTPVGEHLEAQTYAMCKYTNHQPQIWTGEGVGLVSRPKSSDYYIGNEGV